MAEGGKGLNSNAVPLTKPWCMESDSQLEFSLRKATILISPMQFFEW